MNQPTQTSRKPLLRRVSFWIGLSFVLVGLFFAYEFASAAAQTKRLKEHPLVMEVNLSKKGDYLGKYRPRVAPPTGEVFLAVRTPKKFSTWKEVLDAIPDFGDLRSEIEITDARGGVIYKAEGYLLAKQWLDDGTQAPAILLKNATLPKGDYTLTFRVVTEIPSMAALVPHRLEAYYNPFPSPMVAQIAAVISIISLLIGGLTLVVALKQAKGNIDASKS